MSQRNPLFEEALRGFGLNGQPQQAYLGYLAVQALVLWVWWPKQDIASALASEKGPDTLLAIIVAMGAAVAYHSLRAGAEEFVQPGHQSLREWAGATPVPLQRILGGYLGGHIAQTLHLMLLSSPLVLMAFTVAGAGWAMLAWSALGVLVQATFYRLAGAVAYLTFGHLDALIFVSLRAFILTLYIGALAVVPVASHVAVTYRMLGNRPDMAPPDGSIPAHVSFILIYACASVALAAALYRQLAAQRQTAV